MPTDALDITTKARSAWWVLEAADLRGLPAPFDVQVAEHQDYVRVGLDSPADFRVWAEAIDSNIGLDYHLGRTHLTAEGELLDVKVRVFHVMPALEVAAR